MQYGLWAKEFIFRRSYALLTEYKILCSISLISKSNIYNIILSVSNSSLNNILQRLSH